MLNYKLNIDDFFKSVFNSILKQEYNYRDSLLNGVPLLLEIRKKGISKEEIQEYINEYYQTFCSKETDYNRHFDDFLVDFVADIKGPPWSRNLDFWDSKISFEDYKKSVL
ncbi:hypothetical protein [Aquimarina sp. RZ0]|uniref:hypothetical protein n=1 Tax=Aquimarina sp. RZ0 TaxID=2607730 RepID=UPI0011F18E27|nr:hypothetical protein [Aquimarina sp. RZ0]KAA1246526.1 hypothetical protein F0000_07125 [Aquimarina sp. RZ0]